MIGADNQDVLLLTDCLDLVKMSSPTERTAFSAYLEELQSNKDEFTSFSLSSIFRSANLGTKSLYPTASYYICKQHSLVTRLRPNFFSDDKKKRLVVRFWWPKIYLHNV